MRVCTALSTVLENPTKLNSSENNEVFLTDRVPELEDVVNSPLENLENMKTSIHETLDDTAVEEIAAFLDILYPGKQSDRL